MKKKLVLTLAAVMLAVSTMTGATAALADVNVYTTEGIHTVNGRQWRTTCEPYSQTMRCRTEIKATQVSETKDRFVARNDWVFNNLTYLPSPRVLWKGNPLGGNGAIGATVAWSAPDGRQWSTECDTSTTGSHGCRSYTVSRVIEAYQVRGTWQYRWVTRSVFNNIVMFTAPVKPAPPAIVRMPDASLRECVNDELGRAAAATITRMDAATITDLGCGSRGVADLTGLEAFSNLEVLWIDDNEVVSLAPLARLGKLAQLTAYGNNISDITPLARITSLDFLDLEANNITRAAPLATLPKLLALGLFDNPLTDRDSLQPLIDRGVDVFLDDPIPYGD